MNPTARALFLRAWPGCALAAWLGAFAAFAAAPAPTPIIITSVSKQFVVRGVPQRSLLAASAKEDDVYLDPSVLAVTCERVKQTLARELGWGDRWRGTIYVNIRPLQPGNNMPSLRPYLTTEGWLYRIDVPDEIDRTALLETIVEALLLEFANRAATDESVELPPWLVEGLTEYLKQGPLAGAALQARSLQQLSEQPELRTARVRRHSDTDRLLRQAVQQRGALTIDQLNWPEFDENDFVAGEAYHQSAHLFVRGLLKLTAGPDCLCAMLAMLPEHLNWQTAFLRGFEPHFHRMLDVEKWWSLTLTQLRTYSSSVTWSRAEAQQKLDEILVTPVQVRAKEEEPPQVTPVTLQALINDWDFQHQVPLLRTKISQLQAARIHLPPELLALADAYRSTLEKYLRLRATSWFEATSRGTARMAASELDTLDHERATLRGKVLTARSVTSPMSEVPLTHP